jgi:hypothetical protein
VGQARLFDLDPDLLGYVPKDEQAMALRVGQVTVERVAAGDWHPGLLGTPRWGLLIVDGMIAREIAVAGATAAELLGAGDVLQPQPVTGDELVPSASGWTVLENARIAVLDDHLVPLAQRWPAITACLLGRQGRRVDRLAVLQAISHLNRVDTRVLTTLWLLADRWGRVTPDGIVLPLRLTHRTLARLVGARRPSVTSAITELGRRGLVARRTDGSWSLHGPPPEELERVGLSSPISATPASSHPEPTAALAPAPAPHPRISMQHVAAQIRALTASYEQQQARALEIGRSSRETRERSEQLRQETELLRRRLTARPSPAPPST